MTIRIGDKINAVVGRKIQWYIVTCVHPNGTYKVAPCKEDHYFEKGPNKYSQVASLTGSTLSKEAAVAKATINASINSDCSGCTDKCHSLGITGYTDPVALAKSNIVSRFGHF